MEYNLWLKTWQVPYLLITFPILYKVRRQGANEDIIFKIECWLCPCDPLHPLCHLTLPAQSNQVTTSSLLVQDQATSSLPQLICMWSEGGSGWDNWGVFKSDRHEVRHQESWMDEHTFKRYFPHFVFQPHMPYNRKDSVKDKSVSSYSIGRHKILTPTGVIQMLPWRCVQVLFKCYVHIAFKASHCFLLCFYSLDSFRH